MKGVYNLSDFPSEEFLENVKRMQAMMNSLQAPMLQNIKRFNEIAAEAQAAALAPIKQFQEFQNSISSQMTRAFQVRQEMTSEMLNTMAQMPTLIQTIQQIQRKIPFEQLAAIDFSYLNDLRWDDTLEDESELTDEMKIQIQQEVQIQLQELELNDSPTIDTIQGIFEKLSKNIPLTIFINILLFFVVTPLKTPITDEIQESITEVWEDNLQIDLTGEYTAQIMQDTYLRQDIGEEAPVALSQILKAGQPIIVEKRNGEWVRIILLVDGETYTGWVEKSKILK